MTGVTGPLQPLTSRIAGQPLQAGRPPRADQACYRVTARRLRRSWRSCLDTAVTLASKVRNSDHLAEDCRNENCPRFPCVMFHRGYEAGYRKGYSDGHADGRAAGYAEGYAVGYAKGLAERPLRTVYIHVPAGK
jgi:hypothetical protein